MEKKHIELIRRLIQSTKDKKIEWRKSSAKWQYRLELKSASFVIDKSYECADPFDSLPEKTTLCYSLNMYHGEDTVICIASVCDLPERDSEFYLVEELYKEAEESCIKENETINNVIDELDNLNLPY